MNNEELDSQLSAMFDDELPAPECELLARRLARDEVLKARWGRYAAIGACIRSELGGQVRRSATAAGSPARTLPGHAPMHGMRLHGDLAGRVSRLIADEPPLLAGGAVGRSARLTGPMTSRWWQPVAGGAVVAAGVAAAAILWLRAGVGLPDAPVAVQVSGHTGATMVARGTLPVALSGAAAGAATASNATASGAASHALRDPDSYLVPPPAQAPTFVPPVELANFVVAHSEYSTPLLRRSVLSALIVDEPATDGTAAARPVATAATAPARRDAVSVRTLHAPNAGHSR